MPPRFFPLLLGKRIRKRKQRRAYPIIGFSGCFFVAVLLLRRWKDDDDDDDDDGEKKVVLERREVFGEVVVVVVVVVIVRRVLFQRFIGFVRLLIFDGEWCIFMLYFLKKI